MVAVLTNFFENRFEKNVSLLKSNLHWNSMKTHFLSPVLVLSIVVSMAGCVFYFKDQFALHSVKHDRLASIKLEKEQPVRMPRLKPLKLFRPPKVVPGFISFTVATAELTNRLRNSKMIEARKKVPPQSMQADAQKVEQIENLAKQYIKDGDILAEMDAFGNVSTTLAARMLTVYNALMVYDKHSTFSLQLKDTVKRVLVNNSDTVFFEISQTFEDTLSAFPDVAVNFISLVEGLKISHEQKVSYYSAYLDRKLVDRVSREDENRDRTVGLALSKLKSLGVDEGSIQRIVNNFIQKNAYDPQKRLHAILLSKNPRQEIENDDGEWSDNP